MPKVNRLKLFQRSGAWVIGKPDRPFTGFEQWLFESFPIVDRFYRTPGTHRTGFGLGLSIVKELVRAHGGRVAVESTPGAGSTFRVSLPLVADGNAVVEAYGDVAPRRTGT